MGSPLKFQVLGELEVTRHGATISFGSPTQRALLSLLLMRANTRVSLDVLVDSLWDDPPARATEALRVHVSQLRKQLEPELRSGRDAETLLTVPGGYMLRLDPHQMDSHLFEEQFEVGLRRFREGSAADAANHLAAALAKWRGTPFSELSDLAIARPEISRLEELLVQAHELWIETQLQLGRHEATLPELAELLERHPHRERLWSQLMLALYRAGRQQEALEAYRRVRSLLREDLGVEPGPRLKSLHQQILRQEAVLSQEGRVHLPKPLTSFVGRETEIGTAAQLLARAALVTIVGLGGIGKTRLAIETARRIAPRFPEGTWYVDLGADGPGGNPSATVHASLGVPASGVPDPASVAEHLATKRALLVLDGCETVATPTAELVGALLRRCPEVRVLAASRERLRVPGEQILAVPPMGLTPAEDDAELGDAVALLLTRARSITGAPQTEPPRARDLNRRELAAATEIVRTLDGIPLAIELAAARLRTLSLPELATRISETVTMLSDDSRVAVPPRHRTLEATFDWSYRQLDEPERELFDQLWVFRGGWMLGELESVAGRDVLDALDRLVDRSLVAADRRGPVVRFLLLEPVRQFARSHAGSALVADLPARHATTYLRLAAEHGRSLQAGDVAAIRRFEAEEANLVAALERLLEEDRDREAVELASLLGLHWGRTGRYDRGGRWLQATIATAVDAPPAARADLMITASWCALANGVLDEAEELLDEAAVGETTDVQVEAGFYNQLGNVLAIRGEMRAARDAFRKSRELWRSSATPDRATAPLVNLAAISGWMGQPEETERLAAELASTAARHDDDMLDALAVLMSGLASLYADRPSEAIESIDRALPILAKRGIAWHHAQAILWRGQASLALGDLERAASDAKDAQELSTGPVIWQTLVAALELISRVALAREELGDARRSADETVKAARRTAMTGAIARGVELFGLLWHRDGDRDRAALLLFAADHARRRLGLARTPYEERTVSAAEQALARSLPPPSLKRFRREAEERPLMQLVGTALRPAG